MEDIVAHSIISSSMSPGYGKYYHAIPQSFWLALGMGEAAFRQENAVRTDPHFFNTPQFMLEFMRNYGLKKYEGKTFVQQLDVKVRRPMVEGTKKADPNAIMVPASLSKPVFVAIRNKDNEIDTLELYVKGEPTEITTERGVISGYKYYRVERKGYAAAFDELNLRDSEGRIASRSILAGTNGRNSYSGLNMAQMQNIIDATRSQEGTDPEQGTNFEHKCE